MGGLKFVHEMNILMTSIVDLKKSQHNRPHPLSQRRRLEEACIPGVPSVTLRDNTERHVIVEVGSNMLAGVEPEMILRCTREMLEKGNKWRNPFGDGRAAESIRRVMAVERDNDERDFNYSEISNERDRDGKVG